jgi:hypothetical protein
MSVATFSINGAKVAKGPGYLWLNVIRPTGGARVLVTGDNPPKITLPSAVNWAASTLYGQWAQIIDSNGNLQQAIYPGESGTPSAPTWSTALFGVTPDGTVNWMNLGPANVPAGGSEGSITVDITKKVEKIGMDQAYAPVDSAKTSDDITISFDLKQNDLTLIAMLQSQGALTTGTDTGLPTGAQAYTEIVDDGEFPIAKMCCTVIIPKRGWSSPTKSWVISGYLMEGTGQAYQAAFGRTKETMFKGKLEGYALGLGPGQVFQYYEQT